jgi:hypothetical protein
MTSAGGFPQHAKECPPDSILQQRCFNRFLGASTEFLAAILHPEIVQIIVQPDMKERLTTLGFEPIASTPKEFLITVTSISAPGIASRVLVEALLGQLFKLSQIGHQHLASTYKRYDASTSQA